MNPRASTEDAPRYATLRDYLGVLRRHRVMIALITLGFLAAAVLISVAENKTYEATASLQARDICQDAALIGPDCPVDQPAPLRSATLAQLIDRPQIVKEVQKDLKTKITPYRLGQAVTGTVQTTTLLVNVTASATTPKFAADLANAFAKELKKAEAQQNAEQLKRLQKSLQTRIDSLKGSTAPGTALQINSLQTRLNNILALEDISDPVQIVERAQAPNGPASPNTKRNIILGGIVGLFFGLVGSFLRDSLDRRLHSVHEIHQETGIPVLGRVPDTAMGYPGLARNGRVAMSEADFESFRILRTNLAALGAGNGGPRSLMVTSGLPEEGKSTVSMSLASAAALAGQRVLLVECDLRRPSFAARLGVKREPGLTDYLVGRASPQEVLQTVDLREPSAVSGGSPRSLSAVATLVVISAGTPAGNPAELLISERFKEFLGKVTKAYDLVILDSSPVLAVADPLELVSQVDGVLICIRAQQATRDEARATRAAFAHLPERPIGAVVTGLRRGGGDDYEYYYYGE